ncbi:MAG: hypothetical protein IPN49_15770 [Saprospiraceae bacterium]|nr:hypothetical protein [Saprospiraceae bacterium]MBK8082242.1 hypothetical protein [Saprospiraceae bacterium]MBK8820469.1 hypothetical protein [Saprospiraceae bacterium]MBK8820470.1 hypothetical protein [Saprospiraceae bacterium]
MKLKLIWGDHSMRKFYLFRSALPDCRLRQAGLTLKGIVRDKIFTAEEN